MVFELFFDINFIEILFPFTEKDSTILEEESLKDIDLSMRKTLSESEIIANSLIFFIGGFETTATTMSYCLFELTKNPKVQDRLYCELKNTIEQNQSADYHDLVLNQIPYLEAIIKETLRMYTPISQLTRRVVVDKYKFPNVTLEKDTVVIIPAYAIHHHPDYYPEPEKFNPDRFMPENKHLLVPYTYMPFGQGPRNCMGMRFAYQEIKLCLARLILNYQFHSTPKTPEKLKITTKFLLSTTPEFQVKISKR